MVPDGLIGIGVIGAAILFGIFALGYFMIGFLVALMLGDYCARKTGRSHRNCRLIFWPIILSLWFIMPILVLLGFGAPLHLTKPLIEEIKSFLLCYFIIWTPGAIIIYFRSPPKRKNSGLSASPNNNPEQS